MNFSISIACARGELPCHPLVFMPWVGIFGRLLYIIIGFYSYQPKFIHRKRNASAKPIFLRAPVSADRIVKMDGLPICVGHSVQAYLPVFIEGVAQLTVKRYFPHLLKGVAVNGIMISKYRKRRNAKIPVTVAEPGFGYGERAKLVE